MTLHQAYAVKHGSTVLAGLTGLDTQTNPEVQSDVGIGSLYPQFAVISGIRPRLMFSTRAVAAALGLIGLTGAPITQANPLVGYYAKLADGVPVSGSEHQSYTFDRGRLIGRRLQCSHRQSAMLDLEGVTYSSDGVAAPLIQAANAALPAIARDNVRHTLGSATIGGVDLGCITDISIDFGISADTLGCKSDIYDKHLTIDGGIRSVITITTLDGAKLGDTNIPLKGKPGVHADTSIILRKYAEDGIGFVADAEAEHIQITAEGLAVYQSHSGQGPQRSQATIQMTCIWNGTEAPILFDTTYAISS